MSHGRVYVILTLLYLCFVSTALARDTRIDQLQLKVNGVEIKVFTYRPLKCAKLSLLFVFHGLNRKAKRARNSAKDIAQNACLMVFAPLFDKKSFPNWRYHRAGVVRKGRVQPISQWTAPILRALFDLARNQVKNPEAKLYLFGHSAGGQFLSRSVAYTPLLGVDRIVIANPSVYVAPILHKAAPYGFGGVFSTAEALTHIKAYLASPITIYLGQKDIGKKYLVNNAAAIRQGKNRLERGRRIFYMARDLAYQRGWPFEWKLVEVPGVGHSSRRMLRASALYRALMFAPYTNEYSLPYMPGTQRDHNANSFECNLCSTVYINQ